MVLFIHLPTEAWIYLYFLYSEHITLLSMILHLFAWTYVLFAHWHFYKAHSRNCFSISSLKSCDSSWWKRDVILGWTLCSRIFAPFIPVIAFLSLLCHQISWSLVIWIKSFNSDGSLSPETYAFFSFLNSMFIIASIGFIFSLNKSGSAFWLSSLNAVLAWLLTNILLWPSAPITHSLGVH